jgi:uncharacterized tellurite resistance protein B-like protein
MFDSLQELFDKFAGGSPAETPAQREHALNLAAAVLLVEVMRSDSAVAPSERKAVRAALARRLALDEVELAVLIAQAETESRKANDYFHFTSRINDHCTQQDKAALVEAMWGIAYADGVLDANEIHVISKVAGLLNVPHGEYIAAKLRAKEAAGLL